jgi:Ca-activated chloride channel family protein
VSVPRRRRLPGRRRARRYAAGADYTLVLDVSGSMQDKIATMACGVVKVLGQMPATDRVRIVTFNHTATDLTRGWVPTTPDNVSRLSRMVAALPANSSTRDAAALYAGRGHE